MSPDDQRDPHAPLGEWPSRAPLPRQRDGTSPLERLALARARLDVAAMPASEVVQLALWPDTVAAWARDAGVAPAVAYNLLSRFKPYRRVRELLAHRLDVPTFVVDHLVDAPRPLPADLRVADVATQEPPAIAPPGRVSPTLQLPARRDGSNPIERLATWRVATELPALPASLVVQLALFPESLAEWARRRSVAPSMVYGMLAGTQPQPGLREALARRLDVATPVLAALLDAPRREPRRPAVLPVADAVVREAARDDGSVGAPSLARRDAPSARESAEDDPPQLSLPL